MRNRRMPALTLVALSFAASCQTARDVASDTAYELNPLGSTELAVQSVSVVGPYLVADLVGRQERLRVMAETVGACAYLLRPEVRVGYARSGNFGRVFAGEESCSLAGIASLEAWRDRQPRGRTTEVVPRASARFERVHEDERWLLVRGRFPLAGRIGIPAGFDLVALLPNDDACRDVATRGEATLEYRIAGRDPYRMLASGRACAIAGFAMPLRTPAPL
jgi:hypothetical protein